MLTPMHAVAVAFALSLGLLSAFGIDESPYAAQTAQPAAALHLEETDDHIITTLAEGVYAIRHKNAVRLGAVCGNTTVVIGARDVLVVDTCLLPSLARADIALIRKWTDKPVRYIVNTHWHGDHSWGNGAYVEAFPGATIIAHRETPALMDGFLNGFLPQNVAFPARAAEALKSGIDYDGAPLTDERRRQIEADLPNAALRAEEYRTLVTRLPDVTFERELTLDLGGREVRIQHPGRGNTAGDAIVYLPREGIVAAGDLVVYPTPYLMGGFPSEWSATLRRIAAMQPLVMVPGHGAVLAAGDASDYVARLEGLLATVSAAVRDETFERGNGPDNLAAVETAVRARAEVAAAVKRIPGAEHGLGQLIAAAYREIWGR